MYIFSFILTGYLVKEVVLDEMRKKYDDCHFKFNSSVFSLDVTVEIKAFNHECAAEMAATIERDFLISDPGASRNSKLEYIENLDEKRRTLLKKLIPPTQFEQFDLLRKK